MSVERRELIIVKFQNAIKCLNKYYPLLKFKLDFWLSKQKSFKIISTNYCKTINFINSIRLPYKLNFNRKLSSKSKMLLPLSELRNSNRCFRNRSVKTYRRRKFRSPNVFNKMIWDASLHSSIRKKDANNTICLHNFIDENSLKLNSVNIPRHAFLEFCRMVFTFGEFNYHIEEKNQVQETDFAPPIPPKISVLRMHKSQSMVDKVSKLASITDIRGSSLNFESFLEHPPALPPKASTSLRKSREFLKSSPKINDNHKSETEVICVPSKLKDSNILNNSVSTNNSHQIINNGSSFLFIESISDPIGIRDMVNNTDDKSEQRMRSFPVKLEKTHQKISSVSGNLGSNPSDLNNSRVNEGFAPKYPEDFIGSESPENNDELTDADTAHLIRSYKGKEYFPNNSYPLIKPFSTDKFNSSDLMFQRGITIRHKQLLISDNPILTMKSINDFGASSRPQLMKDEQSVDSSNVPDGRDVIHDKQESKFKNFFEKSNRKLLTKMKRIKIFNPELNESTTNSLGYEKVSRSQRASPRASNHSDEAIYRTATTSNSLMLPFFFIQTSKTWVVLQVVQIYLIRYTSETRLKHYKLTISDV